MRRKAGDGVDLIENQPSVGRKEEIHPCHAAAVKRAVEFGRERLHGLFLTRRDSGRRVDSGGDEMVFLIVGEKAFLEFDLIGAAQREVPVPQYGTADFKS